MPEFIPGGGAEVDISAILAPYGKALWTLPEKQARAEIYESEHPGVTVRRDWEKIDEHIKRLKARKLTLLAEPTRNMDPARAERLLRLQRSFLEGLTTDHPEYDRLWKGAVDEIHLLEDVIQVPRTRYARGVVPKKEQDVAPSPELMEKLARYSALKPGLRRQSIEQGKNLELLALIRDSELDLEIKTMAVQRIAQLRATAVDEPE